MLPGLDPGEYTVTWGAVSGWITPSNSTQTLGTDQTVTFSGTYIVEPSTGTIVIDPSPDALNAPWSLLGPDSYSTSGTGDSTLTGLDPGEYTVTWGAVSGWMTPSNSTQTLTADETVTFSGTYVETGTVTDIDGNVYQTVTIGSQEWMAENLKVTHYRNGDPIPNVTDNGTWSDLTTGAYCDYNNDVNNVATYGRLYNWYAADDSRNIAPEGWHVPTDEEWKQLEMYLGMSQAQADATGLRGTDEGGKLKEAGTTHWLSPNTGATNENGFTALPGGYRYVPGTFYSMGNDAVFWSSTEGSSSTAWYRMLDYSFSGVYRDHFDKQYGYSVRCVRDEETGTIVIDPSPDALNAPWSLLGPDSYSTSGTGDSTLTGLDPGEYTVTWGAVSGWITPSNSTQTLTADETVTFSGTYVETGTVTDIDGNVYQTVTIGDQVWMMENLKVTHYRNGDPIPNVTDNGTWSGLTTGANCDYNNDVNNVATYGSLYNWYAVDDSRNIAPAGWHVPTDEEWKQLEMYLGMSQAEADGSGWRGTDEGGKLKETGTTHWPSPNTGATNESGFTALPGGYRYSNGSFYGMGSYALFWSSTEISSGYAWNRNLDYSYSQVYRSSLDKHDGFSVRCVRDGETGTIVINPSPDSIDAPWSLLGPDSYSTSGTGDSTLTGLDPGEYTVTWGAVSGWITPSNSTQTLTADETVTFSGTYVETGTVTDIDGNVYQTVTIGTQVWMMENLKVTHYRNGDAIPNVTNYGIWAGLTTGAYCDYNNDVNRVATYGRLYNWYAVADSRSIAPAGWHVPTDEEWKQLEMYLGMSQAEADATGWRGTDEGGKLKETGTTHWLSPNPGATNESGFTALPGGFRNFNGSFYDVGGTAYFWSSTEYDGSHAWDRDLYCSYSMVDRGYDDKQNGYSVRCVRDEETGTVTDIDGNVYQTVTIGTQVWMMENLKVTHYRNGDPIPNVTDNGTWSGLTTGAYCDYNNDVNNVATYGSLYNWYAVDDSRNIAPAGWHVPTDEEWKQLEMYLGMSQAEADGSLWRGTDEGGKLKEAGTTHWLSPNTGATNESGFTALSGGFRSSDGSFNLMGYYAPFWSSTEGGSLLAWARDLVYAGSQVNRDGISKRYGYSVRCVRDY
jgi:uncharacterized protein (TIGR02145 family)